jgi:hypothetical protein
MDRWSGTLEPDGTIMLDPTDALLPTVIHECLHEMFDDLDYGESVIVHMEQEIVKSLSSRQWTNLLRRVAEIV